MRQVPSRCGRCGEPNIHNLDYCAVCGYRFQSKQTPHVKAQGNRGDLTREQKLKIKRMKKRKELTELFRKGKISREQFLSGLRKLGYSTDIDKAEALKKYIREQIKAFEEMRVDPRAREGAVYYDPNESRTDLPRDEYGNVITDFSISPGERRMKPTDDMPTVDHGGYGHGSSNEPYFGSSLFPESGRKESKRPRPPSRVGRDETHAKKPVVRRRHSAVDWDDEEEEVEEEDFEIDLSEEGAVESGWWDDDEWELEWTDEDENELDESQVEWEEDEDEWVLEDDRIEWEDDGEEEEGSIVNEIGSEDSEDDEEEWSITIRKHPRKRNR